MMYKKILFIVLAILLLVPMASTRAIYLGVQITATQPTTVSPYTPEPGKLWCLGYGSIVNIKNSGNAVLASKTLAGPVCPGGTVWLGPIDSLGSGTYTITIATTAYSAGPVCSGYRSSSNECYEAWDTAGQDKNCDAVCGHYGQTAVSGYYSGSGYSNCDFISYATGRTCSSCTQNLTGLNYYKMSDGSCSRSYQIYPQGESATWSHSDYIRVCKCNYADIGGRTFTYSYIVP